VYTALPPLRAFPLKAVEPEFKKRPDLSVEPPLGWAGLLRPDRIVGVCFIPQVSDLLAGLADVGAVGDLACKAVRGVERREDALVRAQGLSCAYKSVR
jgi:hypothetical protein